MHKAYADLGVDGEYDHHTVDHSAEEWARGPYHTNTLEGHWSHFKRAVKGTHVHISSQHMWKYVSEFSYHRNFRFSHRVMFSRLVSAFSLPRLVES
jgi:transposase